jgi:small basic protein
MTPDAPAPAGAPGAPTGESMSLPEACFSIFFAPSKVFTERQNKGWVLPLVILTVVCVLLFFATRSFLEPALDGDFARGAAAAIRKNPQITAAQMDNIRHMQEKFAFVFVAVIIPITVILVGLTLWLVGRFVDSKQSVSTALVVATFACFPKVLATIAAGVIGYLRDPSTVTGFANLTVGPAMFLNVDHASPILVAFAMRLDLFTLWVTVLLGIGLHVTGKVPKAQAYAAAAAVWVIGALPGLFGALRAQG